MNAIKKEDYTDNGYKYATRIIEKISEDKQQLFIQELESELKRTKDTDHQMLNSGDVLLVAGRLHLDYTL